MMINFQRRTPMKPRDAILPVLAIMVAGCMTGILLSVEAEKNRPMKLPPDIWLFGQPKQIVLVDYMTGKESLGWIVEYAIRGEMQPPAILHSEEEAEEFLEWVSNAAKPRNP